MFMHLHPPTMIPSIFFFTKTDYRLHKRKPGFLSHSQLFTCLKLYYSTCQYVKQLICINPFTVNKLYPMMYKDESYVN